eukprot:maker-scaffold646_size120253-snap-gene-0.21 protein:Tk08814 transcript:maker-scaffold646_size120253-snap-gene-0.21-mRNA-1 annotation:"box c d snorna protein 1"
MVNHTENRLGPCQSCSESESKYRCPRCEVTSCSSACVQTHKTQANCTGIRNKTKYIPTKKFTELDLLSDYRLLEEIGRIVDIADRDKSKGHRHPETLPEPLKRLRAACRWRRGPKLIYLPRYFERHRNNSTFYDWQSGEILWKLELVFPHCRQSIVIPRVHEKTKLHEILVPYTQPDEHYESLDDDPFAIYRALGFKGIQVLLKNENVKAQAPQNRFEELSLKKSLRVNLKEKSVLEHPVLFVILTHHLDYFQGDLIQDNPSEAKSSEESRRDLDWSKYQRTTVQTKMAAETTKDSLKRKVEDDAAPASKAPSTFGLFAPDSGDDSEEENSKPHAASSNVSVEAEVAVKTKMEQMMKENGQKWKKPRQEFDDSSFVRAFVNQQDTESSSSADPGDKPVQAEATQAGGTQSKAEDAKAYQQYYDYYLNYYKKKYNLSEEAEAARPVKAQSKAGPSSMAALVDYGSDNVTWMEPLEIQAATGLRVMGPTDGLPRRGHQCRGRKVVALTEAQARRVELGAAGQGIEFHVDGLQVHVGGGIGHGDRESVAQAGRIVLLPFQALVEPAGRHVLEGAGVPAATEALGAGQGGVALVGEQAREGALMGPLLGHHRGLDQVAEAAHVGVNVLGVDDVLLLVEGDADPALAERLLLGGQVHDDPPIVSRVELGQVVQVGLGLGQAQEAAPVLLSLASPLELVHDGSRPGLRALPDHVDPSGSPKVEPLVIGQGSGLVTLQADTANVSAVRAALVDDEHAAQMLVVDNGGVDPRAGLRLSSIMSFWMSLPSLSTSKCSPVCGLPAQLGISKLLDRLLVILAELGESTDA